MEIKSCGVKSYSAKCSIQNRKTSFPEFEKISFGRKLIADCADFRVSAGLKKLKNYTIAEYKTLSKKEKQALRNEYTNYSTNHGYYYPFEAEKLHDAAAYYIKAHLDDKYGKGNYAVITIGRSLSSIGKVLGYKIGEENVVNIPMSRARQYLDSSHVSKLKQEGTIDKFRKYLATQGLEKDKISTSKKQYVIMDYVNTGYSLKGARQLLTRDDLLGKKNICALGIDNCIPDNYIRARINFCLCPCDFKRFSFVDCAPNLQEVPYALVDLKKADYRSKLMWFKLLDNQVIKPKEVSFEPNEINTHSPKLTLWEKIKCSLGLN